MALERYFLRDSASLTVVLAPQGFHFAHTKALARALMRDTDINWGAAAGRCGKKRFKRRPLPA